MQKDDLDGEIDLKSCVKVSEFDVEKNYGFQIQVNVCSCSSPLLKKNGIKHDLKYVYKEY